MSSKTPWQTCASNPNSFLSNLVAINAYEFIVLKEFELMKYNTRKNEWNSYLKVSKELPIDSSTICLHSNNKLLYFVGFDCITKLNIETNEHEKIMVPWDGSAKFVLVDNDIHFIGGYPNQHSVLRENATKPVILYTYNHAQMLNDHHSIYSEQRKVIYTMGGNNENDTSLETIHMYDIKANKNELLDLKIPDSGRERFGCIMTDDERYMIIFGGYEYEYTKDEIYIFDMDKMTVRESDVVCPEEGSYNAILMNDHERTSIIVNGYIRCMVNQIDGIEFPNDDIITLINKWLSNYHEMVYLIERGWRKRNRMWKLPLSTILCHI